MVGIVFFRLRICKRREQFLNLRIMNITISINTDSGVVDVKNDEKNDDYYKGIALKKRMQELNARESAIYSREVAVEERSRLLDKRYDELVAREKAANLVLNKGKEVLPELNPDNEPDVEDEGKYPAKKKSKSK